MVHNNRPVTLIDFPPDTYDIKSIDRKLSSVFIKPGCTFCDVGGSGGIDAIPFAEAGAQGVIIDIDTKSLKRGRDKTKQIKLHKISFICASATALPFSTETFDLVTSFSVIDHLPSKTDAREAIKEFSRVTKHNGHVVVTIPNKIFFLGTIMMASKKFLQPDSFFEQRFTPKELISYFSEFGLKITNYDSKNPAIIGQSIIAHNMPKIVRKIPSRMLTPLFGLGIKILHLSENFKLHLLGARFGVASVKT
ncbi:MAG: class I SAM-dependent methyltransferase [Candidatus Bathyarchaeia archaeon]|jgi:ubiquinone/menaquinone biosynthesis C-methylase UbiE